MNKPLEKPDRFEVNNWTLKRIKELAAINYGRASSDIKVKKGRNPIIGTGGIIGYSGDYVYDNESIIIGRKGTIDEPFYASDRFWAIDTTFYMTSFICSVKWLYYYLSYEVNLNRYNEATGVPSLNRVTLENIFINTPPLLEQEKIANILNTVNNTIEKTEALIEKYQKVKEGMMQDLFTRGIGEDGKLRLPYHEAPELYKETELGMLPKEWGVVTMAEFASDEKNAIVDGPFGSNLKIEHYKNEGVPVIQSGFVTSNYFSAKKYHYVSKEKYMKEIRSQVSPGDIVMAKIGAQCGKCAKLPENHEVGILAGNSLKISVGENNLSDYLEALLHYYYTTGRIAEITSTTAQPAVSLSKLKKMLICRPTKKEQAKIVSSFGVLSGYIFTEEKYLSILHDLKQALMQDLLTGKVRVPA